MRTPSSTVTGWDTNDRVMRSNGIEHLQVGSRDGRGLSTVTYLLLRRRYGGEASVSSAPHPGLRSVPGGLQEILVASRRCAINNRLLLASSTTSPCPWISNSIS